MLGGISGRATGTELGIAVGGGGGELKITGGATIGCTGGGWGCVCAGGFGPGAGGGGKGTAKFGSRAGGDPWSAFGEDDGGAPVPGGRAVLVDVRPLGTITTGRTPARKTVPHGRPNPPASTVTGSDARRAPTVTDTVVVPEL